MAEIKYEVIEVVGTLSENQSGWKKQLNIIKWNDKEPKYDIRDWSPDNSKMGKGITLSAQELKSLKEILNKMNFYEA